MEPDSGREGWEFSTSHYIPDFQSSDLFARKLARVVNSCKALTIRAERGEGDTHSIVLRKVPTDEAVPAEPLEIPPFPVPQICWTGIKNLLSTLHLDRIALPVA